MLRVRQAGQYDLSFRSGRCNRFAGCRFPVLRPRQSGLRAPICRQAPRPDQRHAYPAAQGRLAGRLSGRPDSGPSQSVRRSTLPENRGPLVLPAQVQAEGKPPAETTLNRSIVVEPSPSPTGSMADHHFVLRASEVEAVAWDLAAALGVGGASVQREIQASRRHREGLAGSQRRLRGYRGRSSTARRACSGARDERGARQRRQNRYLYRSNRGESGRSDRIACGTGRRHERAARWTRW